MTASFTHWHSKYLAHRLTLKGHGEDAFAASLSTARVDMKPHQVEAALFALHSPIARGGILADEVGLGKTIEASLVIAQRWAERRRHILLIVPASLRKQWSQELSEKFGLTSIILDAKTAKETEKSGVSRPFDRTDAVVITSYEFAARRADDIRLVSWDLVVFDEAHRLRNVYRKAGSARAKELKAALADRFKILLTATPLQNNLMELYGLVSMVDERFFGDQQTFKIMYAGSRSDGVDMASLRKRLLPIYKRHLRRDVQAAGHVAFTKREATTFDFEPSDRETELYEKVSTFLQRPDSIAFGLKPNQLVIIQARKILGSSVAAITGFLERVLNRLRSKRHVEAADLDDDDNIDELAEEIAEAAILNDEAVDPASDDDGSSQAAIEVQKLETEIFEVEQYLVLAKSIGANAKGEKLIARLPEVLDAIEARGGQLKAVIFTESVRTQKYLAALLAENGYGDRIVLLNGSNADPDSAALYKDWLRRHKGTDVVSGAKSADMKAAVVEAFKSEAKTILIATESGAEGINLQFCSLIVNFDLPWNPQRVEQRIGRCHRYGQKIDVSVVNMLNLRNKAEQRVYELLDRKFKLFTGVFGASDDVLGVIESGIDFERKVVEAVQRGRNDEEVEEAFKALEEKLQAQIDADMSDARKKLFDHMDRDVVARLRRRGNEIDATLDAFSQRLVAVARAELPAAKFHTTNGVRFDFDGRTWTIEWPLADEKGWQFFRLSEGTLARSIVDLAKSRSLGPCELKFDYEAYRSAGFPRLSDVENLKGRKGWLKISVLRVATAVLDERESLVIAALADDGEILDADLIDRLFFVPATRGNQSGDLVSADLESLEQTVRAKKLEEAEEENGRWLDEETDKLYSFADDLEKAEEILERELDGSIKAARRALREKGAIPLEEKIAEQRRVRKMEDDLDELKFNTFRRRKEIRNEVESRLDAIAKSLDITPSMEPVMTIRWEVI
ncbi:SNF2-related protein [uncultured Rhodoblastus sp.]|uniref:SNF2-related protein n=1 Tax=uncultured Rhodoblastus sp. TaxID=543037 RepID=UPI0025D8E243|nr:SNF2-related protein [uncultured Rhodoblastus sp.]